MAVFKCKMCGASLEVTNNETVISCEYCGSTQTLPRLDDEKRENLYDRANHFRRNGQFDKAMGIYEQILAEDKTDAEAYWSIVLCRYGIEYINDSATKRYIPTINRMQYTSILADEDYKSSIEYADPMRKKVYENEGKEINEIQKVILEISQKEEPFDVFICYKETDANGRRTQDSVLANDLYHQLVQEGFKVFFSRITLEDKLGTAYEPYIFAALNSAKVMVVLGTRPEYFNAVWVKNEWSRYLALIRNGAKKTLIPAYKDMDPYDLPDEFSHLQAQDMSKLGFMQDLIRGIKKISGETEKKQTTVERVITSGDANVAPLLKRAFMFLEDGDWSSADEYCEKVLDLDPENAQAYLGKLMVEVRARRREDLKNCAEPFIGSKNYEKAVRFGDEKLWAELRGYLMHINDRNEQERLEGIYSESVDAMQSASTKEAYDSVAEIFRTISEYKDSAELAQQCIEKGKYAAKEKVYFVGIGYMTGDDIGNYEKAINCFSQILDVDGASDRIAECKQRIEEIKRKQEAERIAATAKAQAAARNARKRNIIIAIMLILCVLFAVGYAVVTNVVVPEMRYKKAIELFNDGDYNQALIIFDNLGDYKDSSIQVYIVEKEIIYQKALLLYKDKGKYANAIELFKSLDKYKDSNHLYNEVLKKNRELIESYSVYANSIAAGELHTAGLKSDGTVVTVGNTSSDQNNVTSWTDIVAVSASWYNTVGLRSNGTVAISGISQYYSQDQVSDWADISAVYAANYHVVGLKSNGTVVAVGDNDYGQCDVAVWSDIVAVAAGSFHTVGLKSDGTVVAVGDNSHDECNVSSWTDIVAIAASLGNTVGLKSDGTVVAVGRNNKGQLKTFDWTDIVAISTGQFFTVGIKSDGTVVAVGDNDYGQCDVSNWTDVVAISCGRDHTVGLKSDGVVLSTGRNTYNQCNVSDWEKLKTNF